MNQKFTLKKDGYYKARKQTLYFFLGFVSYIITVMWGTLYFTGTEIPKPSHWLHFYFIFLFIFTFSPQFLREISRAKTANKSYKVFFDEHAIKLEQLGSWDDFMNLILFFRPKYTINHQRLLYKEIISIEKSNNGSFIIKGQQNSYPNTFILSPHIENAKELEITLSEIKRINQYPNGKATIFKNTPQKFFTAKNSFLFFGIYLIILLFACFWFYPINWPLTAFLSIAFCLPIFAMTWRLKKVGPFISDLCIDDTRIMVRFRGGIISAFPFNQLNSIRKNWNNHLVLLTNHVNSPTPNIVILPNSLENFENLEQKLNAIVPITYKGKSIAKISPQKNNPIN